MTAQPKIFDGPEKLWTSLLLSERQWCADFNPPYTVYGFSVYHMRHKAKVSVDLIECDQLEPEWEQGERTKVVNLLAEVIEKRTGLPPTHFNVQYINWRV